MIAAGDIESLLGGHGGGKGGERMNDGGVRQAMLDAAAKTLNLSTTDLTNQLRSGQTLAQIAQAHGTTEQAVIDAALAAAKTQLDQSVSSGTLTQSQADAIYTRVQQQGTQVLTPHGRGPGGPRGPGALGAPTAPQTPAAPQTQSATPNV